MLETHTGKTRRRQPLSLSARIFIAIGIGILTGLFLGELAAPLEVLGDAFVQLLQMTVLPYVTVALIAGLGRLGYSEARSIARAGGITLLFLWSAAMIVVLLMPLAFPAWESASFFSTALVDRGGSFDFLGLYIPANPFKSLAFSLVPAVVLFSISIGIALIGVKEKKTLLDALSTISEALMSVAGFVVRLTPYGVFAIAASAAGTISVDELSRLQIYVVMFVGMALLMTFWVLAGLIASFTPVKYRELLSVSKAALITAFATGSVFVVVPIIAERVKQILRNHLEPADEGESLVDVVVPTAYTFPTCGTLLALSFVLFAGWFTGSPVSPASYPVFALSGLFSSFGGAIVAIPFMLDQMQISADTFQLFLVMNQVVNSRFGMLLAAMHIIVLTLVTAFAIHGKLRLTVPLVVRYAGISIVSCLLLLFGIRGVYTYGVAHEYKKYRVFVEMEIQGPTVEVKVETEPPPPGPPDASGRSALERVRERGVLRVGYFKDRLPYVFVNDQSQVVGFDAEMAHELAHSLHLKLEMVLIDESRMVDYLDAGDIDVVMSGVVLTADRSLQMSFSDAYADATLAFVVKDHRRDQFSSRTAVQKQSDLRIGVPNLPTFIEGVQEYLPQAEVVPLDTPRDFFRGNVEGLDAMVHSAESGSAWSLVYPDFTVAVPAPDVIAVPVVYAVADGDDRMVDFLNDWLELKRRDGTLDQLYGYWILGRDAEKREPRWSIIRDVLGWVD